MVKKNHLDQEYLDLRSKQYADRTFLGGMRLATRTGLFVLAGVVALAAAGAAFFYADQEVTVALGEQAKAQRVANLVHRAERELERARAQERIYLVKADPAVLDQLEKAVGRAGAALDALLRLPEPEGLKSHLATARDALAQYAAQFQKAVEAEKSLATQADDGPRARLRAATQNLQTKLRSAALANLADRVGRQAQKAEMLKGPIADPDIALFRLEYEAIAERIQESQVADKDKPPIRELVNAHRAALAAVLEPKMAAAAEAARLDEIFAYLAPSREAIVEFADKAAAVTPAGFERQRDRIRLVVAGAAGAALLLVVLVGLVMLGSVAGGVRAVAFAAGRLAGGERGVVVPARGNTDAVGAIARALDAWLDNLAEVDHLRAELEETKAKLEQAIERALEQAPESERPPAADSGRGTGPPARYESPAPELPLAPADAPWPPARREPLSVSGASQQLAQASRSVSSAALDVERAEALLRALDEASEKVDALDAAVSSIRDQANLLAFGAAARGPGSEPAADNLVMLAPELVAKGGADAAGETAELYLDDIREATERADETMGAVRRALEDVNAIAHTIAATASSEAIEATSRLLHQSERLQGMLDDLVARIQPGAGERAPEVRGLGLKPPVKSGPTRA